MAQLTAWEEKEGGGRRGRRREEKEGGEGEWRKKMAAATVSHGRHTNRSITLPVTHTHWSYLAI